MNRRIVGFALSAMLLVVLAGRLTLAQDPLAKPDSTELVIGTTIKQVDFEFASDEHWYRFRAEAGQAYVIATSSLGSRLDTELALYDTTAKKMLLEDDDLRDAYSRLVWTCETAGVYYVTVDVFAAGSGKYDLTIAPVGVSPNEAVATEAGVTLSSHLVGSERHYYRVPVTIGRKFVFTTQNWTAGLRAQLALYRQGGAGHLGMAPAGQTATTLTWIADRNGEVLLSVSPAAGTAGVYELVIAAAAPDPLADDIDDDHAGHSMDATTFVVGDTIAGTLGRGDEDWFKFDAVAAKTYRIDVALGTLQDSFVAVFDEDAKTKLASNDDARDRADLGSSVTLRAVRTGTVFVVVKSVLAVRTGTYVLTISAE